MWEAIQPNILPIIITLLTGIVTYVATRIKAKYEEYINNETKQKVVKTVVNAIEQIYRDINGKEKLEKAKEMIIQLLNEKGLHITELEMNMMIEEVVNSFHQNIKQSTVS